MNGNESYEGKATDEVRGLVREAVAKVVSGYSGDPDTRGSKSIKAIDLSECRVGDKLYTSPQPALTDDATQEMCIAGMQEWDVAIREGVREWPEMMRRVYKAMLDESPNTPENT